MYLRSVEKVELVEHPGLRTERHVVPSAALQPQQQRHLRRVSDPRGSFPFAFLLQEGRRVGRDAFGDDVGACLVELRFIDLHQILCQGARLVGADDRNRSHRFAGVHLAHEVVCPEHAPHVERKAESNAHGQPFRNGHDDERHGHHEVFQDDVGDVEPLLPARHRVDGEIGVEVLARKDEEGEYRNGETRPPNQLRQPRKLDVQRCPFGSLFSRLPGYFPDFGRISDALHPHDAVAVGDRRAAHDGVGGIGRFGVEGRLLDRLVYHEFPCQVRFVYLQRDGFEQRAVRGNLFAGVEDDDVAHYDILAGNFPDFPVADDRYGRLFAHGV